jgi:outer membrane murein-binding lipoprotein Lpp
VNALTIAGTVAGALIAISTVLHWTIRHAVTAGAWLAAALRLPAEVDRLAASVTRLSTSVDALALTMTHHQEDDSHAAIPL